MSVNNRDWCLEISNNYKTLVVLYVEGFMRCLMWDGVCLKFRQKAKMGTFLMNCPHYGLIVLSVSKMWV